jgi:acyl-CoA synthetase (NDP forming)
VSDILDRFFHARAMAIIGASSDPEKIGGRPLRQCLELGFEGRIYPVNPSASEIQGLPSYASIADLPGDVDCALIALPAKGVEAAIDECAKKKIPLAIILSSGFAEASERGRDGGHAPDRPQQHGRDQL